MYNYNAIVVSIYDGDTIRVNIDLGFDSWLFNVPIRFYGIDTPEIRGEFKEAGLVSKNFVSSRIPVGSKIIINTIRDSKEKYGRYLGIIFYNGINLNEELISYGNAIRYLE